MPAAPCYPIPTTHHRQREHLRSEHAGRRTPDSWTVGFSARARQPSRRSKCATSARAIRDSGPTTTSTRLNILENNFLNEFKLAQANLYANIAAGRGNDVRLLRRRARARARCRSTWRTSRRASRRRAARQHRRAVDAQAASFDELELRTTRCPLYNPNLFTPAGTSANTGLNGTAGRRANAAAAGLPRNFFVANPDALGGANVTGNGGYTQLQRDADDSSAAGCRRAAVRRELRRTAARMSRRATRSASTG